MKRQPFATSLAILVLAAGVGCAIGPLPVQAQKPSLLRDWKSQNKVIEVGNAELAVVLGANPSPAEKRVAVLLAERIKDRTGIALAESGRKGKLRLVIGTVASNGKIKAFSATRKDIAPLGTDGYCIAVDARKAELYVVGQSDSGVVAGVGRLMREMRYTQGKLGLPALQITEAPQMPNRGMYLWARKHFFAKPDQVDRYIEEFALWGGNGLCFWFEMGMFESFDDPEAQRWLAMYRRFYETARRMGMKTKLGMVVNDAYRSSPQKLRISRIIGCPNHYLCPSKPGSVKQMIAWQEQVLKALGPIDIYNLFPADPGGCSCKECTPWPTRGFWRIAKPLGDRIHKISPKTEIWVATWHLNHKTFGGKDWKNLVANIAKDRPAWFAGFEVGLAPHHKYAAMSAEDRKCYNEAKAPLMVFPDISMWGNHRGMLVNRKYWKSLQAELNDYSPDLMKGGWPYSERWNTDIASVMFLSWFWNSKKPVETVLDEYASFYFGPEAETGRELLELLDDSCKDPNRKQKIRATLAKLESSAPEWVKRDWRWDEIVQSCARFGTLAPRSKPLSNEEALNKSVAASSEFSADFHAGKASDGILSSQDVENCWASANRRDVGAWWQKDLGKKTPIEKVQIQFRGFGGRYHFVPRTITFQVSNDGKKWTTVVSKSANVPANNSAYSGTMYSYDINAQGRYVRLLFEDGTDEVIGGSKVVELVEVKFGKADERVKKAVVPVKSVRVVLPGEEGDQLKRIASVFARQVEERCSAKVTTQGEAPLTVTLTVDPAIGKEGFRISDPADGGIEVVGQNELGVLYGLGKLLRTSRYSKDGFAPASWRGESVPSKPIRGIYFATHFHNFYHDAPVEKIQRYVEDLALWGFNELLVCYDMHHFNGADDPAGVTFRARLRAILLAAKRVGMDVSLVLPANEGYANSPKEMRAQGGGRGAIFKCYVCPNKPGGMQYILKVLGEEFDWAADLKPRSIWIWPYDSGGCGCKACQPWGSKGFMKCVKEVGKLAREKIPGAKIFLSTWFIKGNEWRGIKEQLAQDKGLVDGIVSEPGPHGIVINPKDLGLPLIGFPEISMHYTFPWGGFGATPLTARARSQWNAVKATHAGGFPYSEGIYEDLTKVVFSQLYWNDRPVEATVKEYIAFEFSPDVVEDVYGVVKTLEQNHHWRWWPGKLAGVKLGMNWFPSRGAKPQADPGAEEAYATMKRVDRLLSPQARKAWRWRQLYLRALLDAELKTNGGKPNDLCNRAFAELIEIYHAQNAEPAVRPPLVK